MIYAFLFTRVSIIFRIIFMYHAEGKEYLTAYKSNGRSFVICANHLSMLDPIFIVMAYGTGKKLSIMGKAELFRNPVLGWLFRQVGVFPVERGTGDKGAIEKAINDVKDGHGMLIFPEGTRGTGDKMAKMKSGAFMVAAQTGADIIPVRMIYPTSTRKLKFFAPVVVKIGQPLLAEDLGLTSGSKAALRSAKNTLQESLDNLLDEYNTSVGYIPPQPEENLIASSEEKAATGNTAEN